MVSQVTPGFLKERPPRPASGSMDDFARWCNGARDAAARRACKTKRQWVERAVENKLLRLWYPGQGIPDDTNSSYVASIIQAIRVMPPLMDILDSHQYRSRFTYAKLMHCIVEASDRTDPEYRGPRLSERERAEVGAAFQASLDELLQHLTKDELWGIAYVTDVEFTAANFFERVCAEVSISADRRTNPFHARCEVVGLPCSACESAYCAHVLYVCAVACVLACALRHVFSAVRLCMRALVCMRAC